MTTYDLPEEPKGPLWGPTEDGEDWIEYWRQEGPHGRWYKAKYDGAPAMYSLLTWGELLDRGPLVDEDPRITPIERLVRAARSWRASFDRDFKERARANTDLLRALNAYEVEADQ